MGKLKDNIRRKDLLYKKYKEYKNLTTRHTILDETNMDISITLAMIYDLLSGDINKEIHIDNNGIRIVPCSIGEESTQN